MMKRELLQVAMRKNAIVIPQDWVVQEEAKGLNPTTNVLLANFTKLGYTFSEELLIRVNTISPKTKLELLEFMKEVTGVKKKWTPLVKQWDNPTGESAFDHVVTWYANIFKTKKGTTLPCGHLIPNNTFPIERYNGCPFCGTPFEAHELEYTSGSNKLKILELWTEEDLKKYLVQLLESPVALDATQIENLKILVGHFDGHAGATIKMKETLMIVIDALVAEGKIVEAGRFFNTANDVLRYLWFKHTGFLQFIEPKTIANRMKKNAKNLHRRMDASTATKIKSLEALKLKFDRATGKQYATWLNNLKQDAASQCEIMHPKRGIWVRVIRALRLVEYSKRKGFENLANLLDTFHNETYEVWQGKVNGHKFRANATETFRLLKQRPGLFARSLFSSMLWFGPDETIVHFKQILNKVPARLIFTLNMYAEIYFDKNASRTVKPLGGVNKKIAANQMLQLYSEKELKRMRSLVQDLSLEVIKAKLAKAENSNTTMYIEEELFNIPIAIGDRSANLQDLPGALMGTRFKVEGNSVRLFLQWGTGLPAQHLDMDLSCAVAYQNRNEHCSYAQLVIPGCKHSGDIQRIPHQKGTAEYIDIDMNKLWHLGAKYVTFTCNAYTNGSLTPNLVVGWMNSKHRMKISSKGVAYDPTAVQHQVRIKQSLTKGLVFGVLDVEQREIIWLEMDFAGQVVQNLNSSTVEAMINKLTAKLKIGDLLKLKAEVQGLSIIESAENADEVYTTNWALNTAEVSKLFLD